LAEAYITERYPGFDLEDPDWPKLQALLEQITQLTLVRQPSGPDNFLRLPHWHKLLPVRDRSLR
jgi:hypothetical protein